VSVVHEETQTAEVAPQMRDVAPQIRDVAPQMRVHTRVRHGLRRPHNWMQLVKFSAVGGSGYVVNLCVFAAVYQGLHAHHLVAATAAFVVAVFNNFWLNRHWTFGSHGARDHHAGFQGARFFAVSILAFLVAAGILELLIRSNVSAVIAQGISIVAATPLNFVGNKMWTFGHRGKRAS
jgi:dolichol-phosphate mannosyltransferase